MGALVGVPKLQELGALNPWMYRRRQFFLLKMSHIHYYFYPLIGVPRKPPPVDPDLGCNFSVTFLPRVGGFVLKWSLGRTYI